MHPTTPGLQRGFTLLEIMVVVVLVGILTTLAVINLGGNPAMNQLRTETRRIEALFNLAAEEAALTGRDVGLRVTLDGYEFFVFDPDLATWVRVEYDQLFRKRALPQGLEIDVRLADLEVDVPETDDEQPAPQVVFYSSGDVTPFELVVDSEQANVQVTLRIDALGHTETEYVDYSF